MRRQHLRVDEYAVILLYGGGAGLVWGMASLVIAFSHAFSHSGGVARAIFSFIAMPFTAAAWLTVRLGLEIVDPTWWIIVIGTLGGFVFTLVLLVLFSLVEVIRDRLLASSIKGPLP
jgi:drug/metabolite transporter (DMT)-like permease